MSCNKQHLEGSFCGSECKRALPFSIRPYRAQCLVYVCVCVCARLSGHESYKPMNTWRCCVCVFKLIAQGLLLTKMDIMNISKCHWIGNSSGLEVHSHILKFTKSLFFNCWKTLPKMQQLMYGTTMETTSHLTFFCVLYFWCV